MKSLRVNKFRIQRFLLHCLFILLFCCLAFSKVFPFNIPERLVYDLTWTGIKAGEAVLEVKEDGNHLLIISTAKSAKWVSVFYTVDDWVQSKVLWSDTNPFLHSTNYRLKIREGRHRKDKEVVFDAHNSKAIYIDYLSNERREIDTPFPIFDPLSSFYYLRGMHLEVGKPVYVTIFDSKKVWNVEVQVLRKEKIEVPAGEFDTIVIKPLMKSEGIFYRKGDILIWLTDDEKRIPVKLQTKVKIGSINANLTGGQF
ncbi:MAG: DUF3108 domain-containing protein [Thermodesulfovibrionales bacterium]